MATMFSRSLARLKAAVQSASEASAGGPTAAEQPVVFEKDMDPAVKAALPCSIVKLKSGDFVALPAKRAATFGQQPKLFAAESGSLTGSTRELDVSSIDKIALGILSDQSDNSLAGSSAHLQAAGGDGRQAARNGRSPIVRAGERRREGRDIARHHTV